jgi:hypothetical protein
MTLLDIEQNDVDISQLFRYKKEIELTIPGKEEKVVFYQRLVGDEHSGRARVYALRKSSEFREKLLDKEWEDRVAYIPKISKLKKEEIVDLFITLDLREIMLQSINAVPSEPLPKKPSGDAKLKELEEYQKEVDAYQEIMMDKINKHAEEKIKAKRVELNKVLKKDLIQIYDSAIINQHAAEEFTQSFQEMTTFYGTFKDKEHKERVFDSFEDFYDAPGNLKKVLIASYVDLEIDAQTLKK